MPSSAEDTDPHHVISSYFIGPKAENLSIFNENIETILTEVKKARHAYYPNDNKFITEAIQNSETFKRLTKNLNEAVQKAAELLGRQSVPFWSPRYEGHMCTDLTVPGLLGYFMTMIYNPNNVAVEGSPLTTVVELEAGKQLCEMFGYNTDSKKQPTAWGHITCDGTVANLESIWVARNLKFYPLTLYQAMKEGPLWFIADTFKVVTCVGEEKLFRDLNVWELLNLRSQTILCLADALYAQFGITSKYLEGALDPYSIQTVGRGELERYFSIMKPMKYFHAKTRHYSWPKGGAIAGLGSGNMHGIKLDLDGHIDLKDLESELNRCLQERQPVYAVVAIIGSTEEGAADRLSKIIELRKKFQLKGLSFLVHADAAWGGYFASMIPREIIAQPISRGGTGKKAVESVPSLPLREDTMTDMMALKEADSITVDPHKAGYIPYPAGSLVYRDGRMRFLVTWTSPYLSQGSSENIGVYGVEGSKPGASAMATWFSNATIGLDRNGYGRLLGEAAWTSARLSAHYAAMHYEEAKGREKKKHYICIPFNRLPLEKQGYDSLSPKVNERRKNIREKILDKSNEDLCKNEKMSENEGENERTMDYIRELGSDLNINTFSLNWCDEDGELNSDLEEANYFMKRIVDRLSITSSSSSPRSIPLFLTSTSFTPELYGECAQHFMKRLKVTPAPQDLFVIRNVVMSPFPTDGTFINHLMESFETVIEEEVKESWERNKRGRYDAVFLMRGTDEIFLDYQTSFHRATQRQQLILSATIDDQEGKEEYEKLKKDQPQEVVAFKSAGPIDLEGLVKGLEDNVKPQPSIEGFIGWKNGDDESKKTKKLNLTRIVKSRPLNSANRDTEYPQHYMPFYLYGTKKQKHISHMLVRAPNVSLSASDVELDEDLRETITEEQLSNGLILTLTDHREATMQPFPATNDDVTNDKTFFFRQGKSFNVNVYVDPKKPSAMGPGLLDDLDTPLARGTMKLGDVVHVDVESFNKDPFAKVTAQFEPWKELKAVKNALNGGEHNSTA